MRRVVVTIGGESYAGTVAVESATTLALEMASEFRLQTRCAVIAGGLALIREGEGEWHELFTGTPVIVADACPACEAPTERALVVEEFMHGVNESRTPISVVVPRYTCAACGLIFTGYEAEEIRDKAVEALLSKPEGG